MMMRVYRCTVIEGRETEFREFAFGKSHPWLRSRPGLVAFYGGRPLPTSTDRTRCMVQLWESANALRAAIGDNWEQQPQLPDEVRGFIDRAWVEHYEVADEFRAGAEPPVQ